MQLKLLKLFQNGVKITKYLTFGYFSSALE